MYLLNSACLESQIPLIRKIRSPHILVLGYIFFFFFGKGERWEREKEGEKRREGQERRRERETSKCCSGGAPGVLRKKWYWFETPFMSL